MNELSGQHAFVTGGGSGIGLACARAFLEEGAVVTLMGRNAEKLAAAAAELAALGAVHTFAGDVGAEAQVQAGIEQANARVPLTIVVANAGTGGLSPVMVTEDAEWQNVIQTNLTGTFYTFKHAARAIARNAISGDKKAGDKKAGDKKAGGAMCAISSIAGVRTHRFMGSYCVSKAGIDMLVRNTADELGSIGIRVNSVCPGLVDTEIAAGLFASAEVHEDYMDCMPLQRTGVVEDIANAVRFLCGPQSTWITGVNLSVDGGHHLRRGPDVSPFSRMLFGDDVTEGRLSD